MFNRCLSPIAAAALALCLFLTSAALAQPTGYEGYQVVRITAADDADLAKVRALQQLGHDFEVWSEVVRLGDIEVRVSPAGQKALRGTSLRYIVTIADLQDHLDARFAGESDNEFFNSLRTYDEHAAFVHDLAAQYPDLAEVVDFGTSVQGRTLWALHISGSNPVKPGVFYHGAEHGNEAAGASVVNYIAWTLLEGYGNDPALTALVDRIDWWLMPIMNPDGYVAYQRFNANGVDLNRNWDGPGSGGDPNGGPFAFSEPETAALRDFLIDHPEVRVHLDVHGYVAIIAWSWAHIPDPVPEFDTYLYLGEGMRDRIDAAGGGVYEIGSIYDLFWYSISGCSTNYTYGVLDRWAMCIEMVHDNLPTICHEFLDALLFLGGWIWTEDCNGNGVPDVEDIASGTSSDCNLDGIPDECTDHCPADVNGDCTVDVVDLLALLAAWGAPGGAEDINHDGLVDVLDLLELLSSWGPCPPDPMGACCTPDGNCTDATEMQCINLNGDWYEGEACATFTCPALPTGACCIGDQCIGTYILWDCDLAGGTWYEGDDCATFLCPLIYCDASGGCDEHISHVQVGAIDNPSSCTEYGDYTALSTAITIGATESCTVTNGNPIWTSDEFGAWADWNHDGDFDDAGETIVASIGGVGPYVFDITPPAGAYIGNTTMRLRVTYSTTPTPCGEHSWGEVEDYTITVTE